MSSARTPYHSPPRRREASFTSSRLLFLAQTLRWFALGWGRGTKLHPENRTTGRIARRQGLSPAFHCRSSPRAISTGQLHTLLCFHLRPIKQIVYLCPYSLKDERSHLRGSFTLRCFQRLSRPYIATQLCPWQDNWCTRGTSIPVLSY